MSGPKVLNMADLARVHALGRLLDQVQLDCQPKSAEDAVVVSLAWRNAVLAAAQAVPRQANHFVCPGCGCVDRFGSYLKDGVLTGYCNGRDSSLVGCPARFSWVRNNEEDRKVGLS